MGRHRGFLDLKEQRVLIVIAHQTGQISPRANAADSYNMVSDIDDVITAQQEAAAPDSTSARML